MPNQIKPKTFICDTYFVRAIINELKAIDMITECAGLNHKFIVTPAVVRETLRSGGDRIVSLISNGTFEELQVPTLTKRDPQLMRHLSLSFDPGEIETMLLAKKMNDDNEEHVFPIIDERAAHNYWISGFGNGITIYRTGKFILEASKQWKVIERGKAAEHISKLASYDRKTKELLLRQLKIPDNETKRLIEANHK